MKKYNIPFSPPDITDDEIEEVVDTLKSGWITTGPKTKQFEKMISAYLSTNKTVCLNSQTACAELTLRLLDIGAGDEVITSAYTYTASASVIDHVGAKIVLIDTQKDSLEMDYDALEKAINEHTKAIIPVDIAGIPCDYDKLFEIVLKKKDIFSSKNNILNKIGHVAIITDAAHAFGAEYHGKKIGGVSDFTTFSFHAVKNLTTAEGGAVTWKHIEGIDDEDIYHKYQLMSLHGQSKDAFSKARIGAWEYDIVGPWFKCNMTDIAASMGIATLKRYPKMLDRRREIIQKYNDAFKNRLTFLNHYTKEHKSSGHLYITQIPNADEKRRNELIIKMAEKGISCNVHYKPLPMHTAYKNLGFDINDYPNAYNHFKNEITLPLHTLLSDDEVEYIIQSFLEVL